VLDLLMNENLDESKKFIGALMLINSTNSIFAERKNDLVYSLKDKMNYKYDYLEHDANYSAHKKVQELLNQSNEFDNENLAPYHYGASILGTRAEYIMFPNNYTKNRMSKI
ncbi:MAG: hypothetical protein IJW82_00760, partial [Clostridia bacterium]|nr:hypothetical protein [Clostridia bacterium]